jgi:hypothetical protein
VQQLATASASASAAPIIQSHPLHKIRQGSSAAPSARLWNPVNHSPHSFEAAYQVQYSIAADDGAPSADAWDIDQQSLRYLQEYRRRQRRSLCSSAAPASADGGASDEAPLVSGGGHDSSNSNKTNNNKTNNNNNNSSSSSSSSNSRSRAAVYYGGGGGIEQTASTMRHPWSDAAPHEKSREEGVAARLPAASAEAAGQSGGGGGAQSLGPHQTPTAAVAAGGSDFPGSKFVTDDPERGIRFNAQVAVRSALPPTLHLSRSQSSMRRNNSDPNAGDRVANQGGSSGAVGAGSAYGFGGGGGGGGEGTAAAATALAAGGGEEKGRGGAGGGEAGAGAGAEAGGDAPADETAWSPLHPCFPHPNPHVPLSSPLYGATRIIRIRRDWMLAGDLAPTFSNVYPEVLDPVLPEEQFRSVIDKLNRELVAIFSPWRLHNWADVVLGALTLWLWDDLGLSAVKRQLAALEAWLEEWNEQTGAKEGVRIIPLRRTAYLTVSKKK